MMKEDYKIIAEYCETVLSLNDAKLPEEYFYQSLPLCVIDTVFSLGVKYINVQNTISRYCNFTNLNKIRDGHKIPSISSQQSISSFCEMELQKNPQKMADEVYINRQRTSPINGILKADAAKRFAECLRLHKIEYFQDLPKVSKNKKFEKDIKSITGQGSGISLQYFWMLAGSEDIIKPDRMIIRFLSSALNRNVLTNEALPLLQKATKIISKKHKNIVPRLLDFTIWNFQRNNSTLIKKPQRTIENSQKSNRIPKEKIITNNTSIYNKVHSVFAKLNNKIHTRKEIINIILEVYPDTNPTSVIPSDYCYNIINKGIPFTMHLFEFIGSATFKYLGEDFPYTGDIEWKKQKVGSWKNGNFKLFKDPRK